MIAPAIPDDESQRLIELRALKLLDTPPEERFDRIARLATHLFDVPIAYIALLDGDRQWFKAKCGLEPEESKRSVSFCGHTILQDTPLVIPDARADERFHDNPMVTGDPHIRFYAGHPLRGPGGHNIGTLCIADRSPRAPDDFPHGAFAELAAIAEHELGLMDVISTQRELIETKNTLLETKDRLDLELRNAAHYVESLLPGEIELPGLRACSTFVPSSELGGDFIGCVRLDDRRLATFLLDVTGHGVAASLLAVSIGSSIRQHLLYGGLDRDPGALLTSINRAFQMDEQDGRMATVWLGIFDAGSRQVRYACAGHHPALVLGPDGTRHLHESDLPIGVLADTTYSTSTASLDEGSRLFLFSDGPFEATMPNGSLVGLGTFESMIAELKDSPGCSHKGIIDAVRDRTGRESFDDDVSLVEVVLGR